MKPATGSSRTTVVVSAAAELGRRLARVWREWLGSVVVIVIVVTGFRSAVADWSDVPTGSMRPTILEGDRIVVNKLAYDLRFPYTRWRLARWDDPGRGDIVVLLSPSDGIRLVKRVVGVPGDRVEIRAGALVVNGRPAVYRPLPEGMITRLSLDEQVPILAAERFGDASPHAVMLSGRSLGRRSYSAVEVPSGTYFVIGDNRDASLDSRVFGPVRRNAIIGRATVVAASVDPTHHYLPRWDRFLHTLR
jgi:signal peptidase I